MKRKTSIKNHREKGILKKRVIVYATSFPTDQDGNIRPFPCKLRFRVKRFSNRIAGEMMKNASTGRVKTQSGVKTARKYEWMDQRVREYLEAHGYEFPRCDYVIVNGGEVVDTFECRDAAREKMDEIELEKAAAMYSRLYYETADGREYPK